MTLCVESHQICCVCLCLIHHREIALPSSISGRANFLQRHIIPNPGENESQFDSYVTRDIGTSTVMPLTSLPDISSSQTASTRRLRRSECCRDARDTSCRRRRFARRSTSAASRLHKGSWTGFKVVSAKETGTASQQ